MTVNADHCAENSTERRKCG